MNKGTTFSSSGFSRKQMKWPQRGAGYLSPAAQADSSASPLSVCVSEAKLIDGRAKGALPINWLPESCWPLLLLLLLLLPPPPPPPPKVGDKRDPFARLNVKSDQN